MLPFYGNEDSYSNLPPQQIVITYNKSNPPFKFLDEKGRASGVLIDIWRIWSKKTGIKVEFKEALFSDTIRMIQDNEADIHAGLFYTTKRDKFLEYSLPLIEIGYYIFYHKTLFSIKRLEDLRAFRIGVPEGYTKIFIEKNLPGASVVVYDNFPELYEAAMKGDIKTFISPLMNFYYYIKKRGLRIEFRYNVNDPLYTETYFGAVSEENKSYLEFINEGIKMITKEDITAIERKWKGRQDNGIDKESVIIACNPDYSPFSFLNERGEPIGLFVDFWKLWAKKAGLGIFFYCDNWDETIRSVKDGIADFFIGADYEVKDFSNTESFYELKMAVYRLKDSGIKTDEVELTGKSIAIVNPLYKPLLIKSYPGAKPILFKSIDNAINHLTENKIAGIFESELYFESLMAHEGKRGKFISVPNSETRSIISAITRKGNDKTVAEFNNVFKKISYDQLVDLEKQWLLIPEEGYYFKLFSILGLTQDEKKWLEEHPVITTYFGTVWEPFIFSKEDTIHGILGDYLNLISQRIDIKIQYKKVKDFADALDMIKTKQIDFIGATGITEEKKQYMIFKKPYLSFPMAIASRNDLKKINNIKDLRKLRITVPKGYTSHEYIIKKLPGIKPILVKDIPEALWLISLNKADVVPDNLAVLSHYIKHMGFNNININFITDYRFDLYIATRNDYPELASIFQTVLEEIPIEEKYDIIDKWFPDINTKEILGKDEDIGLALQERAWLKTHPIILFTGNPDWMPIEGINNNGAFEGITKDLLDIISKRLGIKFQFVRSSSWSEALLLFENNKIDCISMVKNPKHEEKMFYTNPHFTRTIGVITKKKQMVFNSLDALTHEKVALIKGYEYVNEIENNYPNLYFIFVNDIKDGLYSVSSGEADLFLSNLTSSVYYIHELGIDNLEISGVIPNQIEVCFGIRKDWPQLFSIMNKALNSITQEEKHQIFKKWITIDIKKMIDYTLIWKIIGISALILIIFIYWNRKLKGEIIHRKKIEKKLKEKTSELKVTNKNLNELNKQKNMLLGVAAHDLRNPLSSVKGFSELLLDECKNSLNKVQLEFLEMINIVSNDMLGLINDLLDISSIESGTFEVQLKKDSLSAMLKNRIEIIKIIAKKKNITIHSDISKNVVAYFDKNRLAQVIDNLISNAIKFSKHNKNIYISLFESKNFIKINIKDEGPGISPEDQKMLFSEFKKLSAKPTAGEKSAGLGLAISKKIIEAHGGKIEVESQLGAGTSFSFIIPKLAETPANK